MHELLVYKISQPTHTHYKIEPIGWPWELWVVAMNQEKPLDWFILPSCGKEGEQQTYQALGTDSVVSRNKQSISIWCNNTHTL